MSYFDSSRRHTTTHATGTRIVRAKMTSFDAIFCRGSKWSSALSLAFAAENIKNLPFALRAREKVWARLVDKSNMMLVRQKLSLEFNSQFLICSILQKKRQGLRKDTKNSESLLLHLQVLRLYSHTFPESKNTQTYKGVIVIITYFLFIGKQLVVVRVICSCFQYKTSLAIQCVWFLRPVWFSALKLSLYCHFEVISLPPLVFLASKLAD